MKNEMNDDNESCLVNQYMSSEHTLQFSSRFVLICLLLRFHVVR
jgi:hypothetical protein